MKYPLLPLSGFPYRITQYILKFPILIIAEILASTTLIYKITWACTQEHNWSYRLAPPSTPPPKKKKKKKKSQKFIWHNNLLFYSAFVDAKIWNLFYSFVNYFFSKLFGEISPSLHNYVYSTKSQESQIKAKRLKVTKKIYHKMISLILP